MGQQHIKLLQGIGVDQSIIDEVENLPEDKVGEWSPDKATGAIRSAVETVLLNDNSFLSKLTPEKIPAEVRKQIEAGQLTRFEREIMEVAKKDLGLEDKDFSDMTRGEKDSIVKTMVRHAANKHLAKKGNVEGLREMQGQLSDMTKQLEEKDTNWETKLNTELDKVNGAANTKVIKAVTRAALATMDGVALNVPPSYITDPILAKLQNNYTIVLDGNDEPQLMDKKNPNLAAMANGKVITFAEALRKQVLEDKVGSEKKEEDDKGGGKRTVIIGSGGKTVDVGEIVPDYIRDKVKE